VSALVLALVVLAAALVVRDRAAQRRARVAEVRERYARLRTLLATLDPEKRETPPTEARGGVSICQQNRWTSRQIARLHNKR
jgi:hypothetical protein